MIVLFLICSLSAVFGLALLVRWRRRFPREHEFIEPLQRVQVKLADYPQGVPLRKTPHMGLEVDQQDPIQVRVAEQRVPLQTAQAVVDAGALLPGRKPRLKQGQTLTLYGHWTQVDRDESLYRQPASVQGFDARRIVTGDARQRRWLLLPVVAGALGAGLITPGILKPMRRHEATASTVHCPEGTRKRTEPSFQSGWQTWCETTAGVLEGPWTHWAPSGQLRKERAHRRGKLHGKYIDYYPFGRLKVEGRMDMGRRTGSWVERFPNGKLRAHGSYLAGQRHGRWSYYDIRKRRRFVGQFRHGKRHGQVTIWRDPPLLLQTRWTKQTATYAKGTRQGPIKRWYPGGELESEGSYDGGMEQGWWTYYFKNGNKSVQGYKNNDYWHGAVMTWREDGALASYSTFNQGLENGWSASWSGASLVRQGHVQDGARMDRWPRHGSLAGLVQSQLGSSVWK